MYRGPTTGNIISSHTALTMTFHYYDELHTDKAFTIRANTVEPIGFNT